MKLYLDTNILVFLKRQMLSEISSDVNELVFDCGNLLYTSAICVQELIHLIQSGKFECVKHDKYGNPSQILEWLHSINVEVVPVKEVHLQKMSELPLYPSHNDPADRLIIAQAIADHTALVSSDRKFHLYESDGLQFVFNRR